MKKWEYLRERQVRGWTLELSFYGDKGWELAAAYADGNDLIFVFKREKESR